MLEFRRFSKQWYWEANKKAGARDDIMFGDYCKDGGCEWEFEIVQEDFSSDNTAVLIRIFDDAIKCLKNKKVLKALTEMEGKTTLEQAEEVLRDNGIREVVVRKHEK